MYNIASYNHRSLVCWNPYSETSRDIADHFDLNRESFLLRLERSPGDVYGCLFLKGSLIGGLYLLARYS